MRSLSTNGPQCGALTHFCHGDPAAEQTVKLSGINLRRRSIPLMLRYCICIIIANLLELKFKDMLKAIWYLTKKKKHKSRTYFLGPLY